MARRKKETAPAAEETVADEESEAGRPVLILDDEQTFGLGPGGGSYVTLYERVQYHERTEIVSRRWKTSTVYEPGDYGPWKSVAWPGGKFPIADGVRIVANKMMDSELDSIINQGGELKMVEERLNRVFETLMNNIKAYVKDIKL